MFQVQDLSNCVYKTTFEGVTLFGFYSPVSHRGRFFGRDSEVDFALDSQGVVSFAGRKATKGLPLIVWTASTSNSMMDGVFKPSPVWTSSEYFFYWVGLVSTSITPFETMYMHVNELISQDIFSVVEGWTSSKGEAMTLDLVCVSLKSRFTCSAVGKPTRIVVSFENDTSAVFTYSERNYLSNGSVGMLFSCFKVFFVFFLILRSLVFLFIHIYTISLSNLSAIAHFQSNLQAEAPIIDPPDNYRTIGILIAIAGGLIFAVFLMMVWMMAKEEQGELPGVFVKAQHGNRRVDRQHPEGHAESVKLNGKYGKKPKEVDQV